MVPGKDFGYLFNDETGVDTQEAIDALRARLGPRASLAQVAVALMNAAQRATRDGDDCGDAGTQAVAPFEAVLALYDVMDHLPVGVCVVDGDLQVRLFNRMARELLDFPDHLFARGLPQFRELLLFNAQRGEYGPGDPDALADRIMELARRMEPHHFERKRPGGTVLDIRGEPLPGGGFVTIWTDVTEKAVTQEQLAQRNRELEATQRQLVQSEKLASIGQLAAGVAHEINNPIGYVHSNIGTLQRYLGDLFGMLGAYEAAESGIASAEQATALRELRRKLDVDFLKEDIPTLMGECKEGISRVNKIIQDLKDFSRVDVEQEWQFAHLHAGIDSTLNIVNNEIKYKADVVKEYGDLPEVECLPSQLNQVFMNLLVNAAHATGEERGTITIRTGAADEQVWLEFSDTGCGIPEELRQRIFDPFFTTKPVGKGTGLGLSLAYGIIQTHNGRIEVDSAVGRGTTFRIVLPVRHTPEDAAQPNGVGS